MEKKLRVLLFFNENSQFSKLHLLKLLVQTHVELIGIITNHNQSFKSKRTRFISIYNFFKRLKDRIKFEYNVLQLRLRTIIINSKRIRIMRPNKLNNKCISEIVLMEPDLIISAGYYRKIPDNILKYKTHEKVWVEGDGIGRAKKLSSYYKTVPIRPKDEHGNEIINVKRRAQTYHE